MERPRIEQFQDETTYSMDWIAYSESMRIYCAAIESKLIESNRRLVAEEEESITLQERIDALEAKLKVAESLVCIANDYLVQHWDMTSRPLDEIAAFTEEALKAHKE